MKSNLDKDYKTSSACEKEGIWFEFQDNVAFRIKRLGGDNSKEVEKARIKFFKPQTALIEQNLLPIEKEREFSASFFVESCLVDWRGVVIDGKETPFEKDVAIKLLSGLPELLLKLMKFATEMEHFKEDYKESLGNS